MASLIFKGNFWSEMAREVKSSFGTNGLKKSNRAGIRPNSTDGSDILARFSLTAIDRFYQTSGLSFFRKHFTSAKAWCFIFLSLVLYLLNYKTLK